MHLHNYINTHFCNTTRTIRFTRKSNTKCLASQLVLSKKVAKAENLESKRGRKRDRDSVYKKGKSRQRKSYRNQEARAQERERDIATDDRRVSNRTVYDH